MSKFKVAFLVFLASLSAVVVNTAESGHIPLIRVSRDSTLEEKLKITNFYLVAVSEIYERI